MSALNRLFSPKTIAVIGGRIAESVVVELNKLGFAGHIWPVNPNRAQMDGIACFKSIDALPGVPDAVYIVCRAILQLSWLEYLQKWAQAAQYAMLPVSPNMAKKARH